MKRVSNYNIYLQMKDQKKRYLLVQGYRGSFDIVDETIAELLQNGETDSACLDEISEANQKILEKRGYITNLSKDKEQAVISKVSETLNNISRKNMCITIMPTYNCNFRCEYCFEQNLLEKGQKWLSKQMDKETVDAIFIQLEKYKEEGNKIGSVYLFGGEPLLRTNRKVVEYICQKCREQSIPISCISNGYDLDKYIDLLKEYQFQRIQITIDGIGSEHDKRRYLTGGQGTYERIMKNISQALDNGVNILLRTNVNQKNVKSMKELIEEYQKRGWVDNPNFKYYFKSTLQCYESAETVYSEIEIMEELSSCLGKDIDKFQYNTIYQGLATSIRDMVKNNRIAPLRSGYCGANTGMYTIDPFGDIYPCWDVLAEPESRIGKVNINKGEFELNSNHDLWKGRTVDKIEDCKSCKYMLFCGGGCSAQAQIMNDDMNKVFCDGFTQIFDEVAVAVCEQHLLEEK